MSESNDLSLQGGTRPKRGGDQSQKSDEKWTHLGNDDDLTNGAKTCIFNPDGVFGIHRYNQPNFHPKEQAMGKINWNRVILGGLVAGVIINIFEFVLNGLILAKDMEAA